MEAPAYSLVQETLVRDLLYESAVALLVVDDEMRILVANRAAAELSGYTADELTKLQSWQITGDREQSARNAERVHLGGRPASQSKVRHKDGHIVSCSYFAWEVGIASLPFIAILLWRDEQPAEQRADGSRRPPLSLLLALGGRRS